MPRYYFNLSNKRSVTDPYGTELLDKNAAMSHALGVLIVERYPLRVVRFPHWPSRFILKPYAE